MNEGKENVQMEQRWRKAATALSVSHKLTLLNKKAERERKRANVWLCPNTLLIILLDHRSVGKEHLVSVNIGKTATLHLPEILQLGVITLLNSC